MAGHVEIRIVQTNHSDCLARGQAAENNVLNDGLEDSEYLIIKRSCQVTTVNQLHFIILVPLTFDMQDRGPGTYAQIWHSVAKHRN